MREQIIIHLIMRESDTLDLRARWGVLASWLVIEAPEEIDCGGALIATTAAHFQMAVDAVFKANRRAAARRAAARRAAAGRAATTLPNPLLQGQKEILRHVAPESDTPSPQLGTSADVDGIEPERRAEAAFQLRSQHTPGELLSLTPERVALAFRQTVGGLAYHQQRHNISL